MLYTDVAIVAVVVLFAVDSAVIDFVVALLGTDSVVALLGGTGSVALLADFETVVFAVVGGTVELFAVAVDTAVELFAVVVDIVVVFFAVVADIAAVLFAVDTVTAARTDTVEGIGYRNPFLLVAVRDLRRSLVRVESKTSQPFGCSYQLFQSVCQSCYSRCPRAVVLGEAESHQLSCG